MRLRTGYSFRTAMGTLDEVMAQVDTPWAPITDRASSFGFVKWDKLAKAQGKKPIFGVELAVIPDPNAKKITRSYFTFIATSSLLPLNQVLHKATRQFRYEPLLTYSDLANLPEGLLVLPGRNAILEQVPVTPLATGGWLRVLHGPSTPASQLRWAQEQGIPRVAGSDNYFPSPDDREAYEVMMGRGATSQAFPMHILSQEELARITGPEALQEAQEMAMGLCSVELAKAQLLSPERPASLEAMCRAGAERLGVNLANPVYEARLAKELSIIEAKGFEDYFFILADLVAQARKLMFVGPARGSSCGSLVCYLMGITQIDPIPFGLIFERFIDITRDDLPDIDIDFSDQRRHLALEYLQERYGQDHMAQLGTVALYRAQSALNETAGALNLPKWEVGALERAIIERPQGDARTDFRLLDTFVETDDGRDAIRKHPELAVATRLEGHPRHYSKHAAGVVLTAEPVENYVAVDARTNATFCDMKDAEALGLLKLDALGLTQLSVFEDALEMVGKPREWLNAQPLDDQAALDIMRKGAFAGIFQWNGDATQGITRQITIDGFEDLVSLVALSRPGPLSSGGTAEWIERKNGRKPISYLHPAFEPHLATTQGILVFQEQVMSIARDIGQMEWPDVIGLRRAIGKKLGAAVFNSYGDKFKAGAARLGIEPYALDKFWADMLDFGVYAFNRSHSVAYALIAYWCCLLKAHHPLEFAAATLTHERDLDKQRTLLRELVAEGYSYQPIDVERSTDKWQAVGGKLIGPISNIKGMGPKLLAEVMKARSGEMEMPKRAKTLLENAVTPIDELFPLGKRLQELFPEGLESAGVISEPVPLDRLQAGHPRTVVVVARIAEITPRDSNEPQAVARRDGKRLRGETRYLNLILEDDSGKMMGRIGRFKFGEYGQPIIDAGDVGNGIYVLKGKVGSDFRVLEVERCKLLGKMKGE